MTPEFSSGRQFPLLTERQALDGSEINGIDQGNFTLGPSADARITFIDEVAQFQNTLGVYLIDPGRHDPQPQGRVPADRACRGRSEPTCGVRPGGGPLQTGDSVLLSTCHDPGELQEGTAVRPVPHRRRLDPERRPPERRARVPARQSMRRGRRRSCSRPSTATFSRSRATSSTAPIRRRAGSPTLSTRRRHPDRLGAGARRHRPHRHVRGPGPGDAATSISTTRSFRSTCCRPSSSTSASCRRSRPTS